MFRASGDDVVSVLQESLGEGGGRARGKKQVAARQSRSSAFFNPQLSRKSASPEVDLRRLE